MNRQLILFVVLFIYTSCNNVPDAGKSSVDNEHPEDIINRLISDVPVTLIDFDEIEQDTLYPLLVIGGGFDIDHTDSLFLASPNGCLIMNDSIYISDGIQHTIFVSDKNGTLTRRIGNEGQAPGEFRNPASITKNNNHIFVEDLKNRRIQIFDHNFRYIRSIPTTTGLIRASISANDSIIVIPQMLSDDNVIGVYRAQFPFEYIYSFFPHIDPHPVEENRIRVTRTRASVNNNGYIAATTILHPYIFIFNQNNQLTQVIEYTNQRVKRRNDTSRIPGHMRNQGFDSPMLSHHLYILDNDRILLSGTSDINVLELDNTGKYNVTRRYRLLFEDEIYERFNYIVLVIGGACISDETICFTIPYDYRLLCYQI